MLGIMGETVRAGKCAANTEFCVQTQCSSRQAIGVQTLFWTLGTFPYESAHLPPLKMQHLHMNISFFPLHREREEGLRAEHVILSSWVLHYQPSIKPLLCHTPLTRWMLRGCWWTFTFLDQVDSLSTAASDATSHFFLVLDEGSLKKRRYFMGDFFSWSLYSQDTTATETMYRLFHKGCWC